MAGRRRRMAYDVQACLRANLRVLDGKSVVAVGLQGAQVAITTQDGETVSMILRTSFAGDD